MAKKLSNRSKTVQFLKTSTPGRIGGLYSSSITLKPGQSITVSDADYAAMTIDTSVVDVQFAEDAVIDSKEEVEAIVAGGGGGGTTDHLIVAQLADSDVTDASTHGIALSTVGDLALSIGADATNTYVQTWNSKPLVINHEGNAVVIGNASLGNGILATPQIQFPVGQLSVWVDNRSLHDDSGNMTVTWRNKQLITTQGTTLDWSAYLLYDNIVNPSMNWSDRLLLDASSANSVDWGGRSLVDGNANEVLSWSLYQLYDASSNLSVDWSNRTLRASDESMSINWDTRELSDGVNGTSLDWYNRQLKKSDGSVVADWENHNLATNGIARVDWGGCMLIDTLGDNGSVDWNNRFLVGTNGTTNSLDWANHLLLDAFGNTALGWQGRWCENEIGQVAFHWYSNAMAGGTPFRPAGALAIGYFYFDTDLNKPIWWNGTVWVDATGTTMP